MNSKQRREKRRAIALANVSVNRAKAFGFKKSPKTVAKKTLCGHLKRFFKNKVRFTRLSKGDRIRISIAIAVDLIAAFVSIFIFKGNALKSMSAITLAIILVGFILGFCNTASNRFWNWFLLLANLILWRMS